METSKATFTIYNGVMEEYVIHIHESGRDRASQVDGCQMDQEKNGCQRQLWISCFLPLPTKFLYLLLLWIQK